MKALIFDTETTGLISNHSIKIDKQPELTEFYGAVVDLASGQLLSDLDLLIKPSQPISAEITKITGLTDADVAGCPSFRECSGPIMDMLHSCSPAIAHNAAFDKEMLDLEAERIGYKIGWQRVICTVEQTIHIKGFRLNLSGLHQELFGEGFKDAHRAKPDTQALIRCCVELFKRGML